MTQLMKKLVFTAIGLFGMNVLAQTESNPWAISFDGNFRGYKGELGNNLLKFNDKNGQVGLGVHRYMHPWFDLSYFINYGNQAFNGKIPTDSLGIVNPSRANLWFTGWNTNINARLKADNGVLLPENSWIGPYLTLGLGFMSLKSKNVSDGSKTYNFATVPLGAGLRFKLAPNFNIFLQSAYTLALNDKLDRFTNKTGNDALWEHKVGLLMAIGGDANSTESKSNLNDDDGDGVPNNIDRCPSTPRGSKVDAFGCTIVSKEANDQLREIIKNIYFETNSANLKAESLPNLDKVVAILNKFPEARLIIEGHTDADGADEYNLSLSQNRADAVKKYLVSKGIGSDRLAAKGYGETMPVATNATPEGKAQNRRVELILTK